jgi:hypothetical protein
MKMLSRKKIIHYLSGLLGYYLLTRGEKIVAAKEAELTTKPLRLSAKLSQEILQESGSFISEVNRLTDLAFKKDSNLYRPPTASQLETFRKLASSLIAEDFNRGLKLAIELNYELVKFTDTSSQKIFFGVREKLVKGKQSLGWGSYFIDPTSSIPVLIEVPHVLYDLHTEDIGANVFLKTSARGFLLAGAHRNANGLNTADVCDPISSVFQEVHQVWVLSGASTWQIHGFSLDSHSMFPANTQAVLSNGRGQITPEISTLSEKMHKANYKSYVYHHLAANNPLNQQVNQGVKGSIFSSLGATQNIQGIFSRAHSQPFVHIELERSIRESQSHQKKVASCIANSVLNSRVSLK